MPKDTHDSQPAHEMGTPSKSQVSSYPNCINFESGSVERTPFVFVLLISRFSRFSNPISGEMSEIGLPCSISSLRLTNPARGETSLIWLLQSPKNSKCVSPDSGVMSEILLPPKFTKTKVFWHILSLSTRRYSVQQQLGCVNAACQLG